MDANRTGLQAFDFPTGGNHCALCSFDQLTKGHLGKTHAEVGQEDFIRDVRRNLGCRNGNDNGGHEREDVLHCNANGRSTEALRCKVRSAVADDDNLRSDEVRDTYPACDRHCENHGPEARGEQHNKNGNQQNVRNIADNVVDNHHDGIDFFGEAPKCADGDADSHVDKCADKCKGEGNLAPCQIASKVDWPAPPVPRMVCRLKPHLSIAFAGLKCFAVESSRFAYASYPEKIG